MVVLSQFAIVIRDIEVERVFLAVSGSETHNVEQALIVLHRFYANGTPLPEMFGYVVMLGTYSRVVSGRLDHNRFCKRRAVTLHVAML
jgi:hypothetical protein